MKVRLGLASAVLVGYTAIPAWFVWGLWTATPAWNANWWEAFLIAHVVIAWEFVAGNWAWVGYPLRWTFPPLVFAAALHSAQARGAVASAAAIILLVVLPCTWLRVSRPEADAIRLAFPFRQGLYYVAHGGKSKMMNHHSGVGSQEYALDILRLNSALMRCRGMYPAELQRYAIFGSPVASPCDGIVTGVANNVPDLAPPQADRKHLVGNCVMIQCGEKDVFVVLAHLQQGSVGVKPGDRVSTGQMLARVGNSGNSTEPHLHIHAKKGGRVDSPLDGEGVPMLFDRRFLVRNDLVRTSKALARNGQSPNENDSRSQEQKSRVAAR